MDDVDFLDRERRESDGKATSESIGQSRQMPKVEILEVSEEPETGIAKGFYRKPFGFVEIPGRDDDVFVHDSVLEHDKDGHRIRPKNEAEVKVWVGKMYKDGEFTGHAAAKIEFKKKDRYVPEASKSKKNSKRAT